MEEGGSAADFHFIAITFTAPVKVRLQVKGKKKRIPVFVVRRRECGSRDGGNTSMRAVN